MGEVLQFKRPVGVVQFQPAFKPLVQDQELYQFFQFKGYADTYRIVWVSGKPIRAEVFAPKSFEWVQLQRYKEVELINNVADWSTYGPSTDDLNLPDSPPDR